MKKNQFQIAESNKIKCDICGKKMNFLYGCLFDNDRAICSDIDCGAEIEYPTSTSPEEEK